MLKTYIFDFDGTIADTLQLALDSVNELSTKYNFPPVNNENINTLKDNGLKEFFISLNLNMEQAKEVIDLFKHKESKEINNINIFPELHNALIDLSNEGIKLGILTSNSENNARLVLENNNINLFDFVISENSIFGKDAVLKNIIEERGLLPQETAYVGDEDRDIEAAKKAGLVSIAVTWGFNSKKHLQSVQPDHLVDSPKDLLEII